MKGKMFRTLKYNFIWTMLWVLNIFLFSPVHTAAAENTYGSLTLQYEAGKAKFSLYQVANLSENGTYQILEPFDEFVGKIKGFDNLEEHDTADWRSLAFSLENCVQENQLKALKVGNSDEKGTIVWKNLSKGLYLILGEQTKDSEYVYTPSPILVTVPNLNVEGKMDAHVEITHNKIEKNQINKTCTLEVMKIWKDSKNKSSRPEEISVQLYRDGKIYDTVCLNIKNNWEHEWTGLSNDYKWTVTEKNIPENYTVEYSKEGNTLYVINHYDSTEIEKPLEKEPSDKLPQSGQFWWPVPILVVFGLTALLIGWIKRKV